MQKKDRVVIVGGGLAGLEAALYLRERLHDKVHVTMVADSETFVFRPFLAYVPFGLDPQSIQLDLTAIAARHGIQFHTGHVERVEPARKLVHAGAQSYVFDYAILATGAAVVRESTPGLRRGHTLWDEAAMLALRRALQKLVEQAADGTSSRIVFLVPPSCAWSGPLYEMALMTAAWLRRHETRRDVELALVTAEPTFIEALGSSMHAAMADELAKYHITAATGRHPARIEAGRIVFESGPDEPFDILVNGAVQKGSGPREGIAVDQRGFYRTHEATRQSLTSDDIYAVGDGSDYPVKQGFLALLQADTAAEHIASRILDVPPEFTFAPSTFWMMDELGATLLAHGLYREEVDEVESLPEGRLSRLEVMGYLPKHSRLGQPLYAGLLWKGTEIGLRMLEQLSEHVAERPC